MPARSMSLRYPSIRALAEAWSGQTRPPRVTPSRLLEVLEDLDRVVAAVGQVDRRGREVVRRADHRLGDGQTGVGDVGPVDRLGAAVVDHRGAADEAEHLVLELVVLGLVGARLEPVVGGDQRQLATAHPAGGVDEVEVGLGAVDARLAEARDGTGDRRHVPELDLVLGHAGVAGAAATARGLGAAAALAPTGPGWSAPPPPPSSPPAGAAAWSPDAAVVAGTTGHGGGGGGVDPTRCRRLRSPAGRRRPRAVGAGGLERGRCSSDRRAPHAARAPQAHQQGDRRSARFELVIPPSNRILPAPASRSVGHGPGPDGSDSRPDADSATISDAVSDMVARSSDPTRGNVAVQIAYTEEQEALRHELRTYFADLMTPDVVEECAGGRDRRAGMPRRRAQDGCRRLARASAGRPSTAGRAKGELEQFIFFDEAWRAQAPIPFLTINTVGRTIMEFGTEAQKELLPAQDPAAASSTSRSATPSRRPAPTWPRCAPPRSATATSG